VGLNPFGPDAHRPFVPLKLMFKLWESCSFDKVPDCPWS